MERIMQSKLSSFIEANTNAIVGLGVSFLFTYYGLPFFFDVQFGVEQSIYITACYFGLSVLRCYALRRLFNKKKKDYDHIEFRKDGLI